MRQMREILFRGKRIDNDEWVYGSFCMDAIEQFKGPVGVDGFIRLYDKAKDKMQMHEVDRETVGQYTGLKDKNGKRIFEGDILCWVGPDGESGKVVVVYFGGAFMLESVECPGADADLFADFEIGDQTLEIIGNIHDNPKLLEGGADG